MHKKKRNYVKPWWEPFRDIHYYGLTSRGYFRDFHFKQNYERDLHDADDFRELGISKIAWRHRGRDEFPTNWEDLGISRGYMITSWKDKTRKKKQYMKD